LFLFKILPLCGKKRGGDFCGFAARKKKIKEKNNAVGGGLLTSRRFLFRLSLVFLLDFVF